MRIFLICTAIFILGSSLSLHQPDSGGTGEITALKEAASQFRSAVLSGDYSRAYELTSSAYQKANTIGDLRWNFQKMTEQPGLIGLKALEEASFYEPSSVEEPPHHLGTAYLVIEKTIDERGEIYEDLEAFTITLIKEGGRPLVDDILFGRRD